MLLTLSSVCVHRAAREQGAGCVRGGRDDELPEPEGRAAGHACPSQRHAEVDGLQQVCDPNLNFQRSILHFLIKVGAAMFGPIEQCS